MSYQKVTKDDPRYNMVVYAKARNLFFCDSNDHGIDQMCSNPECHLYTPEVMIYCITCGVVKLEKNSTAWRNFLGEAATSKPRTCPNCNSEARRVR